MVLLGKIDPRRCDAALDRYRNVNRLYCVIKATVKVWRVVKLSEFGTDGDQSLGVARLFVKFNLNYKDIVRSLCNLDLRFVM